jgi:hypothetical protein
MTCSLCTAFLNRCSQRERSVVTRVMALECRLTERDKQKKFVQVKLMSFIFKQTSRKATVEIEISEDSKFVRFEFNGYVPVNYYFSILRSRLAGLAPNLKSATLFSVHHSHCMMISQSLKGSGVRKNWHAPLIRDSRI